MLHTGCRGRIARDVPCDIFGNGGIGPGSATTAMDDFPERIQPYIQPSATFVDTAKKAVVVSEVLIHDRYLTIEILAVFRKTFFE